MGGRMVRFLPMAFLRPLQLSATIALLAASSNLSAIEAVPFTVEGPGVNAEDFRVTVFASGLDFPLGVAELPDASIIATVSEGDAFFNTSGKLIRLVDTDQDGVADGEPQVLYSNLPGTLTAVEVAGSLVFVTGAGKPLTILRLGESLSEPLTKVGEIQLAYSGGTYHAHSALEIRTTPGASDSYDVFFQLGADTNYGESTRTGTVQSSDVPGAEGTLLSESAYMLTIVDHGGSLSASNLTRVGSGLRNAAGFAFHPTTGDLYFQDNGIDGLVDANEPHSADELNVIARDEIGAGSMPDFGFPHNYTAYRTGEVVGGEGLQPVMVFQPIPDPHAGLRSEGPNDIAFAPPAFPEGLNRGIFLGFHGKFMMGGLANDENPVVYADPESGEYFHFIRGKQDGLGHPIGLHATRDSLFVADLVTSGNMSDGAGKGVIYQIKSIISPTPPDLSARRTGSLFELKWDRGVLQQADEVGGPWNDVADAFSPYPVEPEGPRRFYRAAY